MTTEPLTQPIFSTAFGRLRVAQTINQNNGVIGFLSWQVANLALTAPLAASSTYYINAQSAAAGPLVTVNKKPDFPRNVQITASGATTASVVITGLDTNGYVITETLALSGTGTVSGKKSYSMILTVQLPTIAATTVSVGIGVQFGLQNRVQTQTVLIATVDNAADSNTGTLTIASTAAGTDYYGTWTPATAPNGTHNYSMFYIPTDYQNAGVNN